MLVRSSSKAANVVQDACMAFLSQDRASERERTVFILGAGFSRAISNVMPLTDELGLAALGMLRDRLPPHLAVQEFPRGLNFEAWLSELASDQPYLSDADNALNQAAFLLFSEAIAEILGDRVAEVLEGEYPEWLLRLVSAMHHEQATAITFNYDPLIECMVGTPTGILGDPDQYGEVWNGVSWTELSGGLPPWAPGDAHLQSTQVETLRLLKLHGSLNWYWRPGDQSGVSVARRSLPGYFGAPKSYRDEQRRREVPGRSPFVVPPASSKSQYYSNPIAKEMWSQAAQRLRSADQVVILGYSLPSTDVTFSNMLRESILERECSVVVADLDPEPVRDRLVSLGLAPSSVRIGASGHAAIEDFVHNWLGLLSKGVLRHLLDERSAKKLVLAWGDRTAYAPVESLEFGNHMAVAMTSRVYGSFNLATGLNSRPAVSLHDVLEHSGRPSDDKGLRLRAQVRGHDEQPIVSIVERSTPIGQGSGEWLVLQVAATPPAPTEP
jgi:hypothetical protein